MARKESTKPSSRKPRINPARPRQPQDAELKDEAAGALVAVLAQLVECKLRHACPQIGACLERRR